MTEFGDLFLYTFGLGDMISERLLKHQSCESGSLHSLLTALKEDPDMGMNTMNDVSFM